MESSTNVLPSQPSLVQFLTFDKQHKLCYGGYCNLKIYGPGKCLTIEPLNEEFKPLSAFFEWKFVKQKNLLHIFSPNKIQDIILVFKNVNVCEKLLAGINIYFPHISSKEQLYQHELLIPFFYQLFNSDILKIAKDLIGTFNEEEKKKLIKFLKDNNLYDTVYAFLLPDENGESSDIKDIILQNETLSEFTENDEFVSTPQNPQRHSSSRSKTPRSRTTSSSKKKKTLSSRRRGRPKKEDDFDAMEDNKLIHKRLYARAYREQHQQTVKNYQQCAMDFYNALVAKGVDVQETFPQHSQIIQKIVEKLPSP